MKIFSIVPLIMLAVLLLFNLGCEPDDPEDPYPPPNIDHNFGEMTDTRDGQKYKTIQIGTQIWMAENLNYESENSCCIGNDQANCEIFGRLYTWNIARTVCPPGWLLPNEAKWTTLTDYLGGETVAGDKMKSTCSLWWYPTTTPTNESGFSGLPGGTRIGKDFFSLHAAGLWWSSSGGDPGLAWSRGLYNDTAELGRGWINEQYGLSVRCIKNTVENIDPGEYADPFNSDLTYGKMTDSRDGKTYKTIKIGTQTWMAQNLNYTPDTGIGLCYDYDPNNCNIYGRLYDWTTALSVCPPTWHLPNDAAWNYLKNYFGDYAGNKLKSTVGLWEPSNLYPEFTENTEGTNESGWSGLPGGVHFDRVDHFDYLGIAGFWWSSNQHSSTYARSWGIVNFHGIVNTEIWSKENRLSVRCLRTDYYWGD